MPIKEPAMPKSGQTEPSADSKLVETIIEHDKRLFDAFFVSRDIEYLRTHMTDDIEFYHDKNGLMYASSKEMLDDLQRIWKLQDEGTNPKLKRKLVLDSMKVYPLNKYGAVQIANHQFFKVESNGAQTLMDNAKIVHLWKKDGDVWKIARIISYDHQPAKK